MKQNKELKKQQKEEVIVDDDYEDEDEYDIYEDDYEVWGDYLSEDLATAYHVLTDWVKSQGIPLLENCTFPDFVEFCYRFSSGRKPIC